MLNSVILWSAILSTQ